MPPNKRHPKGMQAKASHAKRAHTMADHTTDFISSWLFACHHAKAGVQMRQDRKRQGKPQN